MKKIVIAALAAVGASVAAMPAEASITINFMFKGNIAFPGTVTGQFVFDHVGSGVAATSAIVLTAESTEVINLPVDSSLNFAVGAYNNSFNIDDNGVVSSALFYSVLPVGNFTDNLAINTNGLNRYEQDRIRTDYDAISLPRGNPTFSLAATSPAPEPASWAMMVGGFGLLGAAMRRKKADVSFA